ncbi:ferrous iron transport protein B [Thalassotalea profundi]|uniref:Ferrous iron transport protein B n=1 Tax=Thalassotalea profundi TaxID=2036687 RepID=A0ABQ3J0L0_9GAMM|nr:ferrous iron transport protein B [Thalassotalea profundi]GHF00262.1 ferrous iron transport protein B [Thalassotalea profundi]
MSHIVHYTLVGFANSGKSTLFNQLANTKQTTGNWAGVTVSAKQQQVMFNQQATLFSDLPGIPSLSKRQHQGQDLSISHKFIEDQSIDCLINVVDATQLQRQLYLTTQLLELGLPMLVVLSKTDRKEAQEVDCEKLSELLGCPVIKADARTKLARQQVSDALLTLPNATKRPENIVIPEFIQSEINKAEHSLLAYETSLNTQECACKSDSEAAMQIMQARYNFIDQTVAKVITTEKKHLSLTDRIDNFILHPMAGVPIFLLMMYLLFMFAINVGSAFIDFFDILAGAIFVEYPLQFLAQFELPAWLLTIIEGIGSGIQTVATFIPVIMCLFIGLSLLETSGYLARAAFVVESVMQKIGLPGKAFVPLIVGFGCTVPAVMSARVLDNERERITTIMMSPFMSCGARLPVYALFAAAFFPDSGQNLVFLLYLIGIAAALFTGFLLKATVLSGKTSTNFMELPLYEMPKISALTKRVANRTKSFIFGAGKTIVIVVCFLNFFNSLGTDGTFGHHEQNNSILSKTAQFVTPALAPIGVQEENWQASVGIITGIFAKEALVATFNNLYSSASDEEEGELNFADKWQEATDSIKENLLGIAPDDPLGVDVGNVTDLNAAAEEQEVTVTTYHAMQNAFTGQIGAFSYLLFILLYTPCAAAMGAIKNEVGNRWASFAALWSFTLAYLVATLVYQIAMLTEQTLYATSSITLVILTFFGIYLWLKRRGKAVLTIPISVSYGK